MSHGVAVLLLVLYLGYLIFQMWSHAVSFLLFLSLLESDGQDLYTDEETSLSTAYPAEIRDQVNEKLNIKRRIRYRRNRKQGITEDLESNSTHSDGSPSGEGSGSRVVAKEEEEEELPQMSITATIVSLKYPRTSISSSEKEIMSADIRSSWLSMLLLLELPPNGWFRVSMVLSRLIPNYRGNGLV